MMFRSLALRGALFVATAAVATSGGAFADIGMTAHDRTVATRASGLLNALAAGHVDRALLTPSFRADFTDAVLAQDAAALTGHGPVKRMSLEQKIDDESSVRYVFLVVYADGALSYTFGLDTASDLVDALYVRPAALPQ